MDFFEKKRLTEKLVNDNFIKTDVALLRSVNPNSRILLRFDKIKMPSFDVIFELLNYTSEEYIIQNRLNQDIEYHEEQKEVLVVNSKTSKGNKKK